MNPMVLIEIKTERRSLHRRGIGVLALGFLLLLGIWNATSDHWEPPKSGIVNNAEVDTLLAYPEAYEEFTVAFVSLIRMVEKNPDNATLTFMGVNGVLSALVPSPLEGYKPGDNVAITGTSYVVSRGYILVDAIQKINHQVVIGLSILAGVIFAYYFFSAYAVGPRLSLRWRE